MAGAVALHRREGDVLICVGTLISRSRPESGHERGAVAWIATRWRGGQVRRLSVRREGGRRGCSGREQGAGWCCGRVGGGIYGAARREREGEFLAGTTRGRSPRGRKQISLG